MNSVSVHSMIQFSRLSYAYWMQMWYSSGRWTLYCCYFILNKRKRDLACCRQKAACQMMLQVLALNFWSLSITCQLRHHEVSCGFHSDSNHCSVKLTWLTAKSRRTSENSSAKNPANLLRPQTRTEMTTRVISFDTNPNNYSIICTLMAPGLFHRLLWLRCVFSNTCNRCWLVLSICV